MFGFGFGFFCHKNRLAIYLTLSIEIRLTKFMYTVSYRTPYTRRACIDMWDMQKGL